MHHLDIVADLSTTVRRPGRVVGGHLAVGCVRRSYHGLGPVGARESSLRLLGHDERAVPMSSGVTEIRPSEPQEPDSSPRAPADALLRRGAPTPVAHHLLALGIYLLIAVALWAHVWLGGDPAHAITCNCGDTVQQVWWFEWLPWALSHGHNPFFTSALWARFGGVNVLSNTSWLFPAAVLAPITSWFGPVASFNVANLLAPVLSGWAAFAFAGRFSRRAASRVLAGAIYAFSPFFMHNTVLGHLDLTLTAFLPLVLLVGLALLTRGAHAARLGIVLGVLIILQFFTSFEVMALTAITGAMCVVGALIARRDAVIAARRNLVVAGSVAAAMSVVVLAYPFWFFLLGPRHVAGPYWKVRSSNPLSIIDTGAGIFHHNTVLAAVGYLGNEGPNTAYLGAGIVLLILLSIPVWRRRRECVVLAVVAVACWILEFFPASLWARLPLLSSVALVRFALPLSLCAGVLVAASNDGWHHWVALRRAGEPDTTRRRLGHGLVLGVVALALVPTVAAYSAPFTVTTATVPAWFRVSAPRLPAGTVVLTMPFVYGVGSRAMAWQAESGDHVDLIGGWVFIPGRNGHNDQIISPLGEPIPALKALNQHPYDMTVAEQLVVRRAALRWRPFVIVDVPSYANPGSACALAATLGVEPTKVHGSWVWALRRTTTLGPLLPMSHAAPSIDNATSLPLPCRTTG